MNMKKTLVSLTLGIALSALSIIIVHANSANAKVCYDAACKNQKLSCEAKAREGKLEGYFKTICAEFM